MKDRKNILLVVACVVCLAIISCRSVMDRFTPCTQTEQSYEYVHESLGGFKEIDSLHNVKKLYNEIVIKHRTEQIGYLRAAEDDDYASTDAIGFITGNIEEAEHLQGMVVGSQDQPYSLLGMLAPFLGGCAIFNMRKRKGDYSPTEVEEVVAKAKRRVD
ncbi:hypothetical protein KAR91_78880 [Candidatus Pacearchaeota archaeon]|nr:hypothetical protein [Candidatus Pacearchaeota archaeon]